MKLLYKKNDFNLSKIFVLRLFKMVANQCSSLEQRSIIKFFMAKKCKLCEIYREECFNQKIFTNVINMDLPLWTQKDTDSLIKEKVLGEGVIKKGHADSILEHEWILLNL